MSMHSAVPEGHRKPFRILSTQLWEEPYWRTAVDTLPYADQSRSSDGAVAFLLKELARGFHLWVRSFRYDAVVTDSNPHVAMFGLLRLLFPFLPRPRHLVLECLWSWPSDRFPLERTIKSLQFRLIVGPRSRAMHYARYERRSFSACFGIPEERFVFIPYHTTLEDITTPDQPQEKRFIFAGGDGQRDYATMFQAVSDLDIPVVIAVMDPEQTLRGLTVPSNVKVVTVSSLEFRRLIRDAYVNVVPLVTNTLRSGGHQTFLNAMALGSLVVVTDDAAAADYIESGVHGLLTPSGHVDALRSAILRLWTMDAAEADQMRAQARARADGLSTELVLNAYLEFVRTDAFTSSAPEYYTDVLTREFSPRRTGTRVVRGKRRNASA